MSEQWANWAGNQSVTGIVTAHPRGPEEIAAVLLRASGEGRRVRPVGSGHSFTGIACPDPGSVQLVLDRWSDAVSVDAANGLVTVQAGMPLHRLNRLLEAAGLAMANLGDIEQQTISGALSTGTHGTGAAYGGLATQLRALELVLPDGSLLRCSAEENPDVFAAARVGLGALGVVSTLTLAVVPLFAIRAEEGPMPLEETLARFDELVAAHDHVEFYWFPHSRMTLLKRNTRLPLEAGLAPLPAWREWWDDEFLSNTVFGGLVALGRRFPGVVRPSARVASRALGARTFTDVSHKVFTSPRRVRFLEMEYAVARADLLGVVRELVDAVERSELRIAFPVEVRVSAADDITLSTASGRDSGYVAVHLPAGTDPAEYFGILERIAGQVGGRPHWGKLHTLDAEALVDRYPRFEEFQALRKRLDPSGLLGNAYLDRVLGKG
ncbi:MAG TPA: D-arabinono-1,4-lactone oxidase [Actinomycetes bacterium]|nr:D-arabinono-1,4-lactone oxidase [Actinomycetes bacterium]